MLVRAGVKMKMIAVVAMIEMQMQVELIEINSVEMLAE
jgi:hypothetical protein